MANTIINPTANETPDSSQVGGDLAVTSPTNTGHGSTITSAALDGTAQAKSIRWFTFPSTPGAIKILSFDWTENGSLVADASNLFDADYSLNNGSSWNNLLQHTNVTSSSSGTQTLTLPEGQDTGLVQLRILYLVFAATGGGLGTLTTSIANVQIQVIDPAGMVILIT